MGKEETAIQRQVMDYLDAKGIYYVRPQAGGYRGGMNLKCNIGAPDIVMCKPLLYAYYDNRALCASYIGIEIKTSTGKQRPAQAEAQKRIRDCGGEYWIIRSLGELMEKLGDK